MEESCLELSAVIPTSTQATSTANFAHKTRPICPERNLLIFLRLIRITWRSKNMAMVLTRLKYLFFELTMLIGLYSLHSLAVDGGDTLALGASLIGNQTLISRNGTFAMGFFSPSETQDRWYVGIWYSQSCKKTIVWVANRQTPVRNKSGILSLSREGHLGVFDAREESVWSINRTIKASRGLLLDSGNFVLLKADNISETVWESFDHPTDAWLPGMKIGKHRKYTSWKNSWDPAPGPFTAQVDPSGRINQTVLIWNDSVQYWASGPWDGKMFARQLDSQLSASTTTYLGNMSVTVSDSDTYVSYTATPAGEKVLIHFVVDKDGAARRYAMINCEWIMVWSVPRDQCDVYAICGAYGTCDPNSIQFCSCVEGFKPRDNRAWESGEWWSSGCVRRSPLQCSAAINGTTDDFLRLGGISLPNEDAVSYTEKQTPQGCRAACLNNCSCTAFAVTTNAVCRLWFGDLLNIRNSSDGQPLFIRVAASELEVASSNRNKVHLLRILIPVGTGLAVILALLLSLYLWRRRLGLYRKDGDHDESTMFLRTFTYKELQIATGNFKNKLGRGGFGSVFKGTLPDNSLVAVKKLENTQGEKQFRAEISTLGNMQHMNLVRLRGFCSEGAMRLLVYDYMPNGSLNSFLVSSKAAKDTILLDWKTRLKIALGTARALVYLHDECRDRIIHCDIKPENILLDEDLCPKVADFGMAKLVGRDFSRVLTTTRGTRGYLAPEWISGIAITPKADVYSFGMTLLELISGRRNLDMSMEKSSRVFFPTWAATQIDEGNIMGILDARIAENADVEEVRRAILVSILCIKVDENVRPSMAQVLLMLEGKTHVDTPQVATPQKVVVEKEADNNECKK